MHMTSVKLLWDFRARIHIHLSSINLWSIQLLPTDESPMIKNLNKRSYSSMVNGRRGEEDSKLMAGEGRIQQTFWESEIKISRVSELESPVFPVRALAYYPKSHTKSSERHPLHKLPSSRVN